MGIDYITTNGEDIPPTTGGEFDMVMSSAGIHA